MADIFYVNDLADENAGIAADQAARFEDDPAIERAHMLGDDAGIGAGLGRRHVVLAIGNAQSAAQIDMLDVMPGRAQLAYQAFQLGEGAVEWAAVR